MVLIEGIRHHDWLRRRAGILESLKTGYFLNIFEKFIKIILTKKEFYKVQTTDFTTHSRVLLKDMLTTASKNGLEIFTNNELLEIKNVETNVIAKCNNGSFQAKNMAVCLGSGIEKFSDFKINKTYAPIAVVDNLPEESKSFVELDYFPKNCINMLTKGGQVGLIGGITVDKMEETKAYIDYVINSHKKMNN